LHKITVGLIFPGTLSAGIRGSEETSVTDDLSMAGLGAGALTEGVKFLYQQAGELLQRRRAKKADVPDVVAEPRVLPEADPDRVAACEDELTQLVAELAKRLPEHGSVPAGDRSVLLLAEALRQVLGAVYGTPIVFSGEAARVHAVVKVDAVAGVVAGVQAKLDAGGTFQTELTVGRVEPGGEVYGFVDPESRR
jgi:hypothetical protein